VDLCGDRWADLASTVDGYGASYRQCVAAANYFDVRQVTHWPQIATRQQVARLWCGSDPFDFIKGICTGEMLFND